MVDVRNVPATWVHFFLTRGNVYFSDFFLGGADSKCSRVLKIVLGNWAAQVYDPLGGGGGLEKNSPPPQCHFFMEHATHPPSGEKNYFSHNYALYSWMFAENSCSFAFGPIPTLPNPYPCSRGILALRATFRLDSA